LRKAKVRALVNHYQRRPGDTGSPEVQAVLLTEKINTLEFHMTRHPQDHQLTRELQILKDRRRKGLRYLKHARFRTYQVICRDLNIEEHTFDIVGKLPRTIPYYDPTRPKYGKPLTEEERKILSQQKLIEKQQAAVLAVEEEASD
jgi:small subunit ribosomal protein S15